MHNLSRFNVILIVLLGFSLVFNIFAYSKDKNAPTKGETSNTTTPHFDDAQKIAEIQHYLDTISESYVAEVKALSEKYKIPSWGCGPSSYALAEIINKKFFENKLRVDASYDNHPYEILIRGGFAAANPQHLADVNSVDHAWIEIYFKDQMLFIDPTIA